MSAPIPKLRGRFSMRGFWWHALVHHDFRPQDGSMRICRTYLRGLLASLRLGEGGGSRLLSGFGRLSLRKKDISECVPLLGGLSRSLKSSHETSLPSCGGSSQVITYVRRRQAESASRISSRAVLSQKDGRQTPARTRRPGLSSQRHLNQVLTILKGGGRQFWN